MAALAERRIIPLDEHKARAELKAEASAEKAEVQNVDAQKAEVEGGEAEVQVDSEADGSIDPNARPEHLRLLEALLFAASAPLDEKTLKARLPEGIDIKQALRELQTEYAPRGVNLMHIGNKWTFRTASDLSWLLTKESVVPKKLSRAAVETLAVIAYHQPVTRAEIEDIRGVAISKGTLDQLLEIGWVRMRGRRKNNITTANAAADKSLQHNYIGRKERKRNFRALWIQRINAAVREHGLTYSRFIDGLAKAGVMVDRKVLSDLAINEPAAFQAIAEKAKAALAA